MDSQVTQFISHWGLDGKYLNSCSFLNKVFVVFFFAFFTKSELFHNFNLMSLKSCFEFSNRLQFCLSRFVLTIQRLNFRELEKIFIEKLSVFLVSVQEEMDFRRIRSEWLAALGMCVNNERTSTQMMNDDVWGILQVVGDWDESGRNGKGSPSSVAKHFHSWGNGEKQKATAGNARDGCKIDSSRIILSSTSFCSPAGDEDDVRSIRNLFNRHYGNEFLLFQWIFPSFFANMTLSSLSLWDLSVFQDDNLRIFFSKLSWNFSKYLHLRAYSLVVTWLKVQDQAWNYSRFISLGAVWGKLSWHLITHETTSAQACPP